ncbi:4-hydroxy-2-oxovalerate aldolase [Leucobacter sp. Psy1]|uniref:4-hydroxy-2-oxovalerate aldolase n=1 Tax=Leucobacter sp. Psy1 TaxID=2875729 RepID=UPI001CD6425D|nr:4-hydroxy-2-oxovalerate aldolase [Leucobacter sp. Psy1]UBH07176.1 4-hydroxy-2-oxovalerate aldolase [Leucobacter sp. Psy1]
MNATDKAPVRIIDTTLRDGSHAVRHQFTIEQVRAVAGALDSAGVPIIEVTHGDGLSGSTFNYGFSAVSELELIAAAADAVEQARIAVLLLPGLGTVADLEEASRAGARVARIATHSTEADVSVQHFGAARELGLETVGFLMLSHMTEPDALAAQARIMADAGCQCVYVVDSAGALLPEGVSSRVTAVVQELGEDASVGFHGHQNLSLGVANSFAAYDAGARSIDGTLRALGAGAGNTPVEVLVTALDAYGVPTGVSNEGILAAAEEVLKPMIPTMPVADRAAIVQGRYGVYNSFLLHAERAADRYGVPSYEVLKRVGQAGYVGGQEDMIIDVAIELRNELQRESQHQEQENLA